MIKLISLTGVSGAGKTTLAKELLTRDSRMCLVESVTTRLPRSTDIMGEYCYVNDTQFEEMKARGEFLWDVAFAGAKYGTSKNTIRKMLDSAQKIGVMILVPLVIPVLLDFLSLDEQKSYLRAYLASPGEYELRKRLVSRGEQEDVIRGRLFVSRQWEYDAKNGPLGFIFLHTHMKSVQETAEDLFRFIK